MPELQPILTELHELPWRSADEMDVRAEHIGQRSFFSERMHKIERDLHRLTRIQFVRKEKRNQASLHLVAGMHCGCA